MQKQKKSYLRSVQQEMKKVSWTSKEELLVGTKMVIIATFIFAFAIYASDVVIHRALNTLSNLTYLIFG